MATLIDEETGRQEEQAVAPEVDNMSDLASEEPEQASEEEQAQQRPADAVRDPQRAGEIL